MAKISDGHSAFIIRFKSIQTQKCTGLRDFLYYVIKYLLRKTLDLKSEDNRKAEKVTVTIVKQNKSVDIRC